jgi:hypothetical protein
MGIFTRAVQTILVGGTFLLASCTTTPRWDFSITKKNLDDLKDLKNCSFPNVGLSDMDNESLLADLLPDILDLEVLRRSDADNADDLAVSRDGRSVTMPLNMLVSHFPFIDSKLEDVVEALLDSPDLSVLLQPEMDAAPAGQSIPTKTPKRIGKVLQAYLKAYFTVWPEQKEIKEESTVQTKTVSCDRKDASPPEQRKISGFISRDGTKFQFPVKIPVCETDLSGCEASTKGSSGIIPIPAISSVDHSQVGADIIRIVLEAVRDGSLASDDCTALPAISRSATGVTEGFLRYFEDECEKKCKDKWKVDGLKEFTEIQTRANAAEAMIATVVGKAIRGGAIGSLNNEALARAVETAAGVIARHRTERVEWCKSSIRNDAPKAPVPGEAQQGLRKLDPESRNPAL